MSDHGRNGAAEPHSGDGGAETRGRPSTSDTGTSIGTDELAAQLGQLALSLEHEESSADTLRAITLAVLGTVPGAEHASISLIRERRDVETLASTGPLPSALDKAQYETGQGPCLDSLTTQVTVRVTDLATEERWPLWAGRATELGARSMLAVQLYLQGQDLGALNLSSTQAGAFDDESEHVALLFAPHAAVAMAGARQKEGLSAALSRRDVIGQAKGILMERFKITGDQAFTLLVRASQHGNRKLHDIADELARVGDVEGLPQPVAQ
ncbi:MAG TPA: GAF and ANTAR domain-containing protein [Actinomycetales bacterium]|jgi:GAF domain-containing protein